MGNEAEKALGVERVIQMFVGLATWGLLIYSDWQDSEQLGDMSIHQIGLHLGKYAVAFVLIKGVSMDQVNEFVRAWRGRDK